MHCIDAHIVVVVLKKCTLHVHSQNAGLRIELGRVEKLPTSFADGNNNNNNDDDIKCSYVLIYPRVKISQVLN